MVSSYVLLLPIVKVHRIELQQNYVDKLNADKISVNDLELLKIIFRCLFFFPCN